MKYTPAQIKAIGGQRYLKKQKKRIIISLALALAWIPLVMWMTTSIKAWVYVAPLIIVVGNIVISYIQARNIFYKQVRLNPELLE